jgi:hypothetical protein
VSVEPVDLAPGAFDDDCLCDFPEDCGGTGMLQCQGCGGDFCVCLCSGEMECFGCAECPDRDDVDDDASGEN